MTQATREPVRQVDIVDAAREACSYGRQLAAHCPALKTLRELVDRETEEKRLGGDQTK